MVVPFALKTTELPEPVGPTPSLAGAAIVAVRWHVLIGEMMLVELVPRPICVAAVVMVMPYAVEVLEVKLVSPEYDATMLWLPPESSTGWSSAYPWPFKVETFDDTFVFVLRKSLRATPLSVIVRVPVGHGMVSIGGSTDPLTPFAALFRLAEHATGVLAALVTS